MTIGKLKMILEKNNIPDTVELWGDSAWEINATRINDIFYNEKENAIILTQNYDAPPRMEDDWQQRVEQRTREWIELR